MRQRQQFKQAIARPATLSPAHNPWWWNPNNPSVVSAPEWFRKKLKEVGEELACTWNPIRSRWQIWSRARIQHPICQGWKLLFIHQDAAGAYLPLDERVFARLYAASVMAHGSAKEYFIRVEAEMKREKEKAEAKRLADQVDMAMPFYEHSQIKVSGFGKSSGSKFSRYHS